MADLTARTYRGVITVRDSGESMDVLFLGDADEPLAETIADDIEAHGNFLSVRYWITSGPMADEVIKEAAIRRLLGAGDATWAVRYSDITGYLWTDEEINVGGHDLLTELRSHVPAYCLLEIDYSRGEPR